MLYRNGPSMQVGKYFSCLLGNAVFNDDIIVTSKQRFVSSVVVCHSCVQAGGGPFKHHFSHALSICRLVDYFCTKCAN